MLRRNAAAAGSQDQRGDQAAAGLRARVRGGVSRDWTPGLACRAVGSPPPTESAQNVPRAFLAITTIARRRMWAPWQSRAAVMLVAMGALSAALCPNNCNRNGYCTGLERSDKCICAPGFTGDG